MPAQGLGGEKRVRATNIYDCCLPTAAIFSTFQHKVTNAFSFILSVCLYTHSWKSGIWEDYIGYLPFVGNAPTCGFFFLQLCVQSSLRPPFSS